MSSPSTNPNPQSGPSSLKILCFGDSLTAGYIQWGTQHYPYAVHLRDQLQVVLPSTKIHIDIEGMSGAQVRGQYTGRLNRACTKAKAEPYHWIIIMGGTNDLGWRGQPEEIYETLSMLWSFPCLFKLCLQMKISISLFVFMELYHASKIYQR